jgi:hypothetical protein
MFGIALPNVFRGIAKMTISKVAVAIFAACIALGLLLTFASDFGADLALTAMTFFG